MFNRRVYKENVSQTEDCGDDGDAQSVLSDISKKEPSIRSKYPSRLSNFPTTQSPEKTPIPPTELSSFIERQEEYIEQLERESSYCREELKNLVEKVREVILFPSFLLYLPYTNE